MTVIERDMIASGNEPASLEGEPFCSGEAWYLARFNRRLHAARAVNRAKADGFAVAVLPIAAEIVESGITPFNGIARELRRRGVPTERGGRWTASRVRALVYRKLSPSDPWRRPHRRPPWGDLHPTTSPFRPSILLAPTRT
jgi:hypothetical protein